VIPQDPKPKRKQSDSLLAGGELTRDALGYIQRGEAIPVELDDAVREWQNLARLQAFQKDQDSANAWYDAFNGMESALNQAIEFHQFGELGMGNFVGVGAGGQTYTPPSPEMPNVKMPEPSPFMLAADDAVSPEAMQRASIATSPIVERDGRKMVVDADGIEWDLTEHLADLQRPEVLIRLRQSLMGSIPDDRMGGVPSQTTGRMFEVQLATEFSHALAAKLGLDVPGDVRYIRTAIPGRTLPWLVPMGAPQAQGIPWRGDEADLAKDPLWSRALEETIRQIDPTPSTTEAFLHGVAGAAEFIGFTKGVGALTKTVGKGLVKALPKGAALRTLGPMVMRAAPMAEGLGTYPLNAPPLRMGLAMAAQTALAESTNPDIAVGESLRDGFKTGLVMGGMHSAASGLRVGATKLAQNIAPKLGFTQTVLAKLTPPKLGQVLTAGAGSKDTTALLSRLREFTDRTFTKTLEREMLAPAAKQSLKGVVDAYWMGVLVHAYNESQAAPDGQGFGAFWRGIISPNAHATGAAFALNGVFQYGMAVRPAVREYLQSPKGLELQERLVRELTQPDSSEDIRATYELFNRWRDAEPDVFKGVEPPPAPKPKAERKPFAEQRPVDAAPTFEAMQQDEPTPGHEIGEFAPEKLRILLGAESKSDAGVYKHGLEAVNEYLREIEGADIDGYSRFADVPKALVKRALAWRDADKPERSVWNERARIEADERQAEAPRPEPIKAETPDETLNKVDGNPRYEGLAPVEKIAKAKATPKRPALGRAIALVAEGKKPVEWLAEAFPEGASVAKDGPVETWAGKFERAVRDEWKKRASSNLKRTPKRPETLQDFVALNGGIQFSSDLANFTRKDNPRSDKRTVVYSKQSGKGMRLDDMVEKAWNAVFFGDPDKVQRPDLNEFVNALDSNVRRADDTYADLTAEHEARAAEMQAFHQAQYRDAIESGEVGIPADDATLMEAYAGDARYIGVKAPQLRKEIEQLRAQAELGDPGAVMAEPPATAATHAQRAMAKTRSIVQELQALDLLNVAERAESNAAMEAVARLARGEIPGDTRGQDIQYHGTSRPIQGLEEGAYSSLNYYGQGFYTTDSVDVATGYSRKGRGGEPTIYRVKEKQPVRVFDLERPVSESAEIANQVREFSGVFSESIGEALKSGKSWRWTFDDARETAGSEVPADEVQENFEVFREALLRQGYGAFDHVGGDRTGVKPHRVRVYLEPERSVDLEPDSTQTKSAKHWARLQEDARIAMGSMREAMRESMRGTWDEGRLTELEDVWSFIDAYESGKEVDPAVRDRLKNWLDDHGRLHTAFVEQMHNEIADRMRSLLDVEGTADPVFYAGIPITFFGRRFTQAWDNLVASKMSWQYFLDKPGVQEVLGIPWVNKTFQAFTSGLATPAMPVLNKGPYSRPQSTETLNKVQRQLFQLSKTRGEMEQIEQAARVVGQLLVEPWGGRRPPLKHQQFFSDGFETGFFSKSKGPADLEAKMPGTGYMWPIYERTRDIYERLAREQLALGTLDAKQYEKYGGGKYLSHYFVRDQLDSDAEELAQGKLPMRWQGRSMMRAGGLPSPASVVFPILDPKYRFERSVYEETRTIRVFSALREISDDTSTAINGKQLAQLRSFDRLDHQRAAIRPPTPRNGETLMEAVRRGASTGDHPSNTYRLGAMIASMLDQMAPKPKKGEDPTPIPGKLPYNAEKERYLTRLLGESKEGPVYIPKALASELEIALGDAFSLPGESPAGKFAAFADMGTTFMKRGFTSLRPHNTVLNLLSGFVRNHAFGGNPIHDTLLGLVGAPSFQRDAMRGASLYLRWIGEQMPEKPGPGWTQKDWADMQDAREYVKVAGMSTSVFVTLGPEMASVLSHSVENPAVTRAAWLNELEARAKAGGWSVDAKDRLAAGITATTDRMYRGLEGVDSKILEWTGSTDPVGTAKAISTASSINHLLDMFMLKYPAYLRAQHEHPRTDKTKLLPFALSRTTNAMDTAPWMRRYISMRAPLHDKLWRASQKNDAIAYGKIAAAMLVRGRFWMDPATMVPLAIVESARHPLRAASSLALTAGAGALITAMMSDDEKRRWQEEAATAKQAVVDWPTPTAEEEAALQEFASAVWQDSEIPEAAAKGAASFWQRVQWKDPTAFPTIEKGGEGRVGSLMELAPAGQALRMFQGTAGIVQGAMGAGTGQERTEQALRGVERLFGMQAQMAAEVAVGVARGPMTIAEALGTENGGRRALANLMFGTLGKAGFGYPVLGLFSPEGKYLGETVFLDGQTWNQYLRGVRREREPEAGKELLGAGVNILWPSRALTQRPPLKGPVDAWTAILAEMYPGFDKSTEDGRTKLSAHKWVSEQMAWLLGDLYEMYVENYPNPETAELTLDEYVAGATQEAILNVHEVDIGKWAVDPGYEPQGTLLKAANALSEGQRSAVLGHLKEWLSRERFQEDGMALLFAAGRSVQIPTGTFREAMKNALLDPSGTNLVRWWWSQAKDADYNRLGELAPLIWDTAIPAEKTAAFDDYLLLRQKYMDAGIEWPPMPDTTATQTLGKEGQSRAVQGGQAFRNVLHENPDRSDLGSLLAPR
jgi:hypothetical protein